MNNLIKSVSQKEWLIVFLLSVFLIILTAVPYLIGYFNPPESTSYTGLHALSPGDIPIYYSYINQVKAGDFFVKNLFTAETQVVGTFNAWWFLVGIAAGIFNLPIILAFQLSRLLMIPVFLVAAYLFIAYFFQDKNKRLVFLLLLSFASGLGFYMAAPLDVLGIEGPDSYWWPIDLWLTEANTFNALYQTSHFIASITLMLLIFLLMLLAFDKNKLNYSVLAGFLSLFYFNFHPYYLPVIFGTLGLYLFWLMVKANKFLWNKAGYLIILFIISVPSIVYHAWLIKISPVIGQRAIQNVTNISPPLFLFAGYGFLWLGFVLGLVFLIKQKKLDSKYIFLLCWFSVNLALIYSPFPFHSRYTQGLHVILVIFSVVALFESYQFLKNKLSPKRFDFWVNNPALMMILFFVCLMPSTLYSYSRDLFFFIKPTESIKQQLFLPVDLLRSFDWLSDQPKGKIILAADIPSKFIPGFSGQTVFIAHAHETLFFNSKLVFLIWFYGANDQDDAKFNFLTKNNIDYVVFSDYEKKLGSFNPTFKDYLILDFDSPSVKIYRVVK